MHGRGVGAIFLYNILFIKVLLKMYAKFQSSNMSGSGQKVCCGWWWWVVVVGGGGGVADTNYLYPARWGWIN